MWDAVSQRDGTADGRFVYAVASTGVYCRPSCPSRLPKRVNVVFHASPDAAESAGFRACKRCRPREQHAAPQQNDRIAAVCRAIEAAESLPSLSELAQIAGLSAHHFHRVFKAAVGVTPRAYAAACRKTRVHAALDQNQTVTAALHEAGFGSSGRFYAASNGLLGMAPKTFRAGGKNTDICFAVGQCSLGAILVAQSDKGVCAILMGDDPEPLVRDLEKRFPHANLIGGKRAFEKLVAQVVGLVESPKQGAALPLDIRGTAFQQKVWQALMRIPPGRTVSYAEIAERIGQPKSVRAVAGACAANAIAVAIPCHRVVRSDGALSGYRWGIARKRALLERERK